MSDTGNDIQATPGPIPPPVGKLPFGYVDKQGKVWLDQTGLIVLQQMWAAIQGGGGLIDIALLELPNAGDALARAQAVVDAALGGIVALDYPAAGLAGVLARARQAEDIALLALGRPQPAPASPTTAAALITSEAIATHLLVNVWNDTGAFHARKADTTSAIAAPKDAHGFVAQGYASGAAAQVQFSGFITGLAGLTPGPAYLGAAGAITSTPNVTAGQISQQVGIAVSATAIWFAPQPVIGL